MKKFFLSLMLGFGAALGVFVALAMPPGGWGVAVGVGLGLLGCLPMFLIMMMLIGRGHTDRMKQVYEEAPQPVIIVQHSGGYDPFGGYGQPLPQYLPQRPAYRPEMDYYAYARAGPAPPGRSAAFTVSIPLNATGLSPAAFLAPPHPPAHPISRICPGRILP